MKLRLAEWIRALARSLSRVAHEKDKRRSRGWSRFANVESLERRLLLATTSTTYSITVVEDTAGDGVSASDLPAANWTLFGGRYVTNNRYDNCSLSGITSSGHSSILANGSSGTYSTTTNTCTGVDQEGHNFTVENVIYQTVDFPLTVQPPVGEYWVPTGSDCGSTCVLDHPVKYAYFEVPSATGVVFHDHNGDGVREAEDEALAGGSVCIGPGIFNGATCLEQSQYSFQFRASDAISSSQFAPTQVAADSLGNYRLPAIPRIALNPPPGYLFALTVLPPPARAGEDVATTGDTRFNPNTTSGAELNRDLGLFYRSNVSGLVYHDHNGNGTRDADDEPFNLRPLSVLPDNNGDDLWIVETDCPPADPCRFGSVRSVAADGTYSVVGPGNFAPNAPSDRYSITEGKLGHRAVSDQDTVDANYGIFENVQYVFGSVFGDLNGNGVWDAHGTPESSVPGVTVELDLNNDGSVDMSTVTDSFGSYRFDNIGAGTHLLKAVLSGDKNQTFPQGDSGYIFSLTSGQAPPAFDFGQHFSPFAVSAEEVFATEGVEFSGQVATIGTEQPRPASAYVATIDWGDKSTSTGTVANAGSNGGTTFFNVSGTHTYKKHGNYVVSVSVNDSAGATATGRRTSDISDAPVSAAGFELNAVEGAALTTVVASFDDQNPFGLASQFTASINWGDGNTSSGSIVAVVGVSKFEVAGTHTYKQFGSKTITVQIQSVGGTSTASATSVVAVSDAPLSFIEIRPDAVIVEGRFENGAVPSILAAYFRDANSFSTGGDFATKIDWGDGSVTTDAFVSRVEAGRFFIQGKHTYKFAGSYPIRIQASDGGGSSATIDGTAVVRDAPLVPVDVDINAFRGVPFTGLVGSFIDTNSFSTQGQFSATIDWGDGFRNTADVVFVRQVDQEGETANLYDVRAQHSYFEPGEYPVRVDVRGGGSTTIFSGSFVISVDMVVFADAEITAIEGQEFTRLIATIEDPGSRGNAGSYRAEIDWADGAMSFGEVRFRSFYTNANNIPVGVFDVMGTHAYEIPGEADIAVRVSDSAGRGASTLVPVVIANAALSTQGRSINARAGQPFSGVVATFTDGDLLSTPGAYTASIDWADGTQSAGTIEGSAQSGFVVVGSHTYPSNVEGAAEILIEIVEPDGDFVVASSPVVILAESDPGLNLIPDLVVDHIEVVQAIQFGDNDVPLVAGKNTVARVFVYSGDLAPGPVPGVTATLRGFRDSQELPGSPLAPINGTITVPYDITPEETNGSFNFSLPADWIGAGDLRLEAQIDPAGTVNELRRDNNTFSETVTFTTRSPLDVAYIAICYQPDPNVAKLCPSNAIATHHELLAKLYPVSSGGLSYHAFEIPELVWRKPIVDDEDVYEIVAELRTMYDVADALGGVVPDQLAAWLPLLPVQGILLGLADPVWFGSTGRVTIQQDTSMGPSGDVLDAQFTLAHEIAHNLGRTHVNTGDGCGAADEFTDWPYNDATIGDLGFDPSTGSVVPFNKSDVMSYCSPPGTNIWISAFTYENLFEGNLQPIGDPNSAGNPSRAARVPHAPADYLAITGTASRNGTSGQIDSVHRITSTVAEPVTDPFGNYCVQLSDDIGFLAKQCFTLNFKEERGDTLTEETFSIIIPLIAGANRLVLKRGTVILDEIASSPGTPTSASFPVGFFGFTSRSVAPGGSTTVTLSGPNVTHGNTYLVYGPTPDNPAPHWYDFQFDGTTGAEFFDDDNNGSTDRVVLHFVDGGRGDLDLTADGVIRDPGGAAQVNNVAPVLNNSGLPYLVAPAGSRLPAEMSNGILITDLLARGAGGNPITDPDSGAVEGIALTGINKIDGVYGVWQYALVANPQASDWINVETGGAISNSSALLLPADSNSRLRFVTTLMPRHNTQATDGSPRTPAQGFLPLETKLDTGISFRAWDRTTGFVGDRADTTANGGTTAFSAATETAGTFFETRLFRSFNAAAQLNTYTLEQEFHALVDSFGYQDRSTSDYSGFTILMSPVPGVTTTALYRMYFGIAFDSPSVGIHTDMGYRYLTTNLTEVNILESIGPAAHRAERDGFYYRELGVNGGTGITGYIYANAQPGSTEMFQIYRTDLFSKETRTGPPGSFATGTVQQEQGDHAYTTKTTFETSKPGTWRLESSRGFVRELSPNVGGAAAQARSSPIRSETSVTETTTARLASNGPSFFTSHADSVSSLSGLLTSDRCGTIQFNPKALDSLDSLRSGTVSRRGEVTSASLREDAEPLGIASLIDAVWSEMDLGLCDGL
jgi:hypothetical protein